MCGLGMWRLVSPWRELWRGRIHCSRVGELVWLLFFFFVVKGSRGVGKYVRFAFGSDEAS